MLMSSVKVNSAVGHSSSYFQGHVIKSLSLGESVDLGPVARTQSKTNYAYDVK